MWLMIVFRNIQLILIKMRKCHNIRWVICLHKFLERGIYCMAFCLDAQFGFLHRSLFKTYHLSAQVYRMRDTLHGFLFHFFCLQAQFGFLHRSLFKTSHLPAQVYRTRYTLHGFLFHFFYLQERFQPKKSSRLLEVTSRINSRLDDISNPPPPLPIHVIWPFPVTVIRLPVGFVNFR